MQSTDLPVQPPVWLVKEMPAKLHQPVQVIAKKFLSVSRIFRSFYIRDQPTTSARVNPS